MKVWLHSTHASEEFNLVRMWDHYGIEITGVFDWGSKQRPKIMGITDEGSAPDGHIVNRDRHLCTLPKDMRDLEIDWYVLMESVDRVQRAEHYARMDLPVAIECFGQESKECDERLVPIVKKYPNIHLVPYSQQIVDRYVRLGIPLKQLHLIRFGVAINEYQAIPHPAQVDKEGKSKLCRMPFWFTAHNSVHRRGKGCGWTELVEIMRLLPFYVLCGNETEKVGGLGELTYDALKTLYRRCTIYLSMGTVPAPYTLTPVEALASSCPIVFYDNGCGIEKEEWA